MYQKAEGKNIVTIIMGVDPGFDKCGWGIVNDGAIYVASGVVKTNSDWTYSERLDAVYNALIHEIKYHNVQIIGVEKPYAGEKVGRRVMEIGGAWGIALLAVYRCGCEYMELSNSHVKAAVCKGGAAKEEVRRGVETILSISLGGKMDDESDALAAAIAARDDWQRAQMVREALAYGSP